MLRRCQKKIAGAEVFSGETAGVRRWRRRSRTHFRTRHPFRGRKRKAGGGRQPAAAGSAELAADAPSPGSPDAAAIGRMVSAPAGHHCSNHINILLAILVPSPTLCPTTSPPYQPANARRLSRGPRSSVQSSSETERRRRRRRATRRSQRNVRKAAARAHEARRLPFCDFSIFPSVRL
jgi:hypothetical protein